MDFFDEGVLAALEDSIRRVRTCDDFSSVNYDESQDVYTDS